MEAFRTSKITPDVVSTVPEKPLEVQFIKSGKEVKLGNELTPTDVIQSPEVYYDADASSFYTLIFTDPDARGWPHWLIVNISGSNVSQGEVINEYVGSAPPKTAGLHRYVFLLYRQPNKLTFDEPYHSNTDPQRGTFSAEEFAKKYNLGNPVAGNFFLAQYDDSVPATYINLGFSR